MFALFTRIGAKDDIASELQSLCAISAGGKCCAGASVMTWDLSWDWRKNKRLEPPAQAAMDRAKELFEKADDAQPTRVFTEFLYAAGTWDKQRCVIAKAEYLGAPQQGKPKENYRFVVTIGGAIRH